jgi:NAD(P)H-dependent FMN reductase
LKKRERLAPRRRRRDTRREPPQSTLFTHRILDVAVSSALTRSELPAVRAWREAIAGSDAVLIASPEYGHSLPGALKNAIDWVIGSGELERKVVAITAAVPGPERGRLGLQALRQTLGAVSARIVGGEPITRGPGFEQEVAELVRALVEAARAGGEYPGP